MPYYYYRRRTNCSCTLFCFALLILIILIGSGQIIQTTLLGLVVLVIVGIAIPIIYWIAKAASSSKPSSSPSYGPPAQQYYNPPPSQQPVPGWETGNAAPASPQAMPGAPGGQNPCPYCGAPNPSDAAFCGNCAGNLKK